MTLFPGVGGIGKSRLILQLAAGIASGGGEGDAWIDAPAGILALGNAIPANGAPVVYASYEDEFDELARRLAELSGGNAPWVTPERVRPNFIAPGYDGRGPVWGPSPGQHIATAAGLTRTGEMVRQVCEREGAALLILDPLAAAYGGYEKRPRPGPGLCVGLRPLGAGQHLRHLHSGPYAQERRQVFR